MNLRFKQPIHPRNYILLAFQIQHGIQKRVRGLNSLRTGLETALGDDQIGKLLRQIDVAHFKGSGDELPLPRHSGYADIRDAGVVRLHVGVLSRLFESALVRESCQRDLAERAVSSVRVHAGDGSRLIDLEVFKIPHRVAVLLVGLRGTPLGELGDRIHRRADFAQIDVEGLSAGSSRFVGISSGYIEGSLDDYLPRRGGRVAG